MFLHELFQQFDPQINLEDVPDTLITGVCDDSRLVRSGDLFVARPGVQTEGMRFIADAAENGAAAIVGSTRLPDCPLPQIPVSNPAKAAAELAHLFYRKPSEALKVIGITGTNGKTTTTYLLRHILRKSGLLCGVIGTVEIDTGRGIREASVTTPGAVELAGILAEMRDNGCGACAMETSSHALHQGRLAGVKFAGGAFTNLTQDHLDYHGNMENYLAAKARLFEMLPESAVAVVNADDPASEKIIAKCQARMIRFGFGQNADYQARDIVDTDSASNFILHTPDGNTAVRIKLIGRHNVANALTAAALASEVFGLSVHKIAAALGDVQAAPGRLQWVKSDRPFSVLVDYAHTDDAMKNVLISLRPITRGKLRVLFGCGGDRDRRKRPKMAGVAAELADVVYVTSDNPRTENPAAIVDEIVTGIPKNCHKPIYVELDRRTAIQKILADAHAGDVVLLAGKGHENYQIIGKTKHHFDDVEEAMRALGNSGAHA